MTNPATEQTENTPGEPPARSAHGTAASNGGAVTTPRRRAPRNNAAHMFSEMRQVPELERMLFQSGIRLFKYWFSVTREEQQHRFNSRQQDPLKQ